MTQVLNWLTRRDIKVYIALSIFTLDASTGWQGKWPQTYQVQISIIQDGSGCPRECEHLVCIFTPNMCPLWKNWMTASYISDSPGRENKDYLSTSAPEENPPLPIKDTHHQFDINWWILRWIYKAFIYGRFDS